MLVKEPTRRQRGVGSTIGETIDLDTVARGKNRRLMQRRGVEQCARCLAELAFGEGQTLALFCGCAGMIQADDDEIHGPRRLTPQKPASMNTNDIIDANATFR